jgi:hypothetical protein
MEMQKETPTKIQKDVRKEPPRDVQRDKAVAEERRPPARKVA